MWAAFSQNVGSGAQYQDDGAEEEEGAMHDDGYTDTLYTTGPIVENSVSLLHNEYENDEELYGGYGDGTNRHLDSDDEDLQNLVDEEMNRSHRFYKEKHLSTSGGEEYDHQDDGAEEDEGAMHNNVYTEARYIVGPVVEHNHELNPTLSHLLPRQRELRRTLKRSLEAHDIKDLRPSNRIRLLEFEAGVMERIKCTPTDCQNYIIQQRSLQTLSSDVATLHKFFFEM
ncbi:hypothetical protein T459_27883 [Capsicum annuum]|uniref:Uncharacterized protein n=1 Tax=Capsicum annuum TaxID=4072 RepID=A0A2G2YF77_CAPAN|nr:hypothetical protein T459_27883 [Capsicum annuum]